MKYLITGNATITQHVKFKEEVELSDAEYINWRNKVKYACSPLHDWLKDNADLSGGSFNYDFRDLEIKVCPHNLTTPKDINLFIVRNLKCLKWEITAQDDYYSRPNNAILVYKDRDDDHPSVVDFTTDLNLLSFVEEEMQMFHSTAYNPETKLWNTSLISKINQISFGFGAGTTEAESRAYAIYDAIYNNKENFLTIASDNYCTEPNNPD